MPPATVPEVTAGVVGVFRFTSEEVTGQNQVKASVQRKIRQNIADEVIFLHYHVPLLPELVTPAHMSGSRE